MKIKMEGKLVDTFNVAARPLMKWIRDNGHEHITVIVRNDSAEIVEGCGATLWIEVEHEGGV